MKFIIIIQCRLNSGRLPGKAALDFNGKPMLLRVIERCQMTARTIDVVVATSDLSQDDVVCSIAERANIPVFRGSLHDVRDRFLRCAKIYEADAFVRVTADNPFVEPAFIDELIATKVVTPDCPYAVHDLDCAVYGTASELVDTGVLSDLAASLPDAGREHVTTGLAELEGALCLTPDEKISDPHLSLTVDTFDQYRAAWQIMRQHGNGNGSLAKIVRAYRGRHELMDMFYER